MLASLLQPFLEESGDCRTADTAAAPLTRGAAAPSLRRSMNQRPARPGGLLVKYVADILIAMPSRGLVDLPSDPIRVCNVTKPRSNR
jgi:hypothetical protein